MPGVAQTLCGPRRTAEGGRPRVARRGRAARRASAGAPVRAWAALRQSRNSDPQSPGGRAPRRMRRAIGFARYSPQHRRFYAPGKRTDEVPLLRRYDYTRDGRAGSHRTPHSRIRRRRTIRRRAKASRYEPHRITSDSIDLKLSRTGTYRFSVYHAQLQEHVPERLRGSRHLFVVPVQDEPLAHDRKTFHPQHAQAFRLKLELNRLGRHDSDPQSGLHSLLDGFVRAQLAPGAVVDVVRDKMAFDGRSRARSHLSKNKDLILKFIESRHVRVRQPMSWRRDHHKRVVGEKNCALSPASPGGCPVIARSTRFSARAAKTASRFTTCRVIRTPG